MWAETGGSESESPSGRSRAVVTLAAGTRLGPYEVLGPLGAGGMGEVYRARDPRLNRDVAIKLSLEDLAGNPERRARVKTEARAVAALNHPNIVSIFYFGEHEGRPYTVSESSRANLCEPSS